MSSFTLTPTVPFDFEKITAYLRTSPSAILETVGVDTWRRALRLPSGSAAVINVRSTGSVGSPQLAVEIVGDAVSPADVEAAGQILRRVFQTQVDAADFFRPDAFAADPVFADLARRHFGIRPVMIVTPFEALIWAILGQQINVAFAAKTKRALVDAFGPRVTIAGETYQLFPEPDELARLDPALLRPLQFSRQKSEYVVRAARAVAAGSLDLEALAQAPADEAVARLTELHGVGRWTAEYVLMRGLGFVDVMPAGDGGLKQILGRWYNLDRQATESEIRELSEKWRPWRGWAAFCWWASLQWRQTG